MNYEVQDNFLDEETYQQIKSVFFTDKQFMWFFSNSQLGKMSDSFYFYHVFYVDHAPNSIHFDSVRPLFDKMNVDSLINVRANLVTNTYGHGYNEKHVDNYTKNCDHKTSIFHLTSNNGKTVLCLPDGEREIDTVENRLITFDANTEHYSKHQTDADRRVLLNINYY